MPIAILEKMRKKEETQSGTLAERYRALIHKLAEDKPKLTTADETGLEQCMSELSITPDDVEQDIAGLKSFRHYEVQVVKARAKMEQNETAAKVNRATIERLEKELKEARAKMQNANLSMGTLGKTMAEQKTVEKKHPRLFGSDMFAKPVDLSKLN